MFYLLDLPKDQTSHPDTQAVRKGWWDSASHGSYTVMQAGNWMAKCTDSRSRILTGSNHGHRYQHRLLYFRSRCNQEQIFPGHLWKSILDVGKSIMHYLLASLLTNGTTIPASLSCFLMAAK